MNVRHRDEAAAIVPTAAQRKELEAFSQSLINVLLRERSRWLRN
jgi:hypothetical protein